MAPGRKRGGAKGAKENSQLKLGDLVLAKVKGFPAWPAKISKPEDWDRTPDPKKNFVQFFGTQEIAFVAPVDIEVFTTEAKDKLLARCKGKTVRYFSQAIREICATFEELENRNSGAEVVDDGLATEGPSGATSSNDIANHGAGLERCSHVNREMESEDVKPNVSVIANDNSSLAASSNIRNELSHDATSPKEENTCTPTAGAPRNNKNAKAGLKAEANGNKSKKIATDPKRKPEASDGKKNVRSPIGFSSVQTGLPESLDAENLKDEARRNSSNVGKNEITIGAPKLELDGDVKKSKKVSSNPKGSGS